MAKVKELVIKNWSEVNTELKNLAEMYIKKNKIENRQTLMTNKIKEICSKKAGSLLADIKETEKNISLFAEANKNEFAKKRSKTLTFGTLSYKYTKKIKCNDDVVAIKALKALDLGEYIKVEEKLNKDLLKELNEAILTKAGITLTKKDSLNIQPNFVALAASGGNND